MGWEQRRNSHYYYTKERVNGRVVSTYHGHGEQGLLIASFQMHHADTRRAMTAGRVQIKHDDTWDKEIAERCKELATLLLLVGGCYQHKGQWRKRRMPKTIADRSALPPRPAPKDTSTEAIYALMARCNMQGADKEDITALRDLVVSARPGVAELGNMLEEALSQVVKGEGLKNTTGLTTATVEAHIKLRKKALGYATASPLEKPLILHVVLCEQRLGIVESIYSSMMAENLSLTQAEYWEKRLNQVQHRYLRAVEVLAKIRRVRVEAWQVEGTQAAGVAVERAG